ncbi:MAG: ABC transporter substrate-binding protein [Desulfobulbaceae bacterium]|nr:ABC transporter substrate-binding protein [Desulfobulbaceae bacterium]
MRPIVLWTVVLLLTTAAVADAAVVSYTDKLNRTVDIPVPVRRAVFLQMYEFLPAMDIWDKVVGVASWAYRSDFIRAARPDIESFPSAGMGGEANIESILQLHPDLVLTWAVRPESIRFMEEKGIRVIAVYPETIPELYEVMRLLGRIFQQEAQLKAAIAEMESIFSLVRERAAKRGAGQKQKMVYLGGQSNSVACGLGINNDMLQMIGGVNPAASIPKRDSLVSLEQLVVWNPEVIFIWGSAGYTAEDIMDNPQWRFIRAVRERRVYKLPRWSTWSPRLALVALLMAKEAYPDEYRDIDLTQVADRFYQKLFGIPYQPEKTP